MSASRRRVLPDNASTRAGAALNGGDGGVGNDTACVDPTGDTVTNGENVVGRGNGGSSISGFVTADGTNAGVSGETIYLDANNNSRIDSGELQTTTGSDGSYFFSLGPAGHCIIRQILTNGRTQSSPANGYGMHVSVSTSSNLPARTSPIPQRPTPLTPPVRRHGLRRR